MIVFVDIRMWLKLYFLCVTQFVFCIWANCPTALPVLYHPYQSQCEHSCTRDIWMLVSQDTMMIIVIISIFCVNYMVKIIMLLNVRMHGGGDDGDEDDDCGFYAKSSWLLACLVDEQSQQTPNLYLYLYLYLYL